MRSINHLIEHLKKSIETGEPFFPQEHDIEVLEEYTNISLPSAEDIQQSEQYKKGFEDAKRAILVEYARESENMRKRNAQLEVMLNIQKELSADAEWIPCNKQMPDELEAVNITWVNHLAPPYYKHIEDVPFVDSAVYYRGKWYWWDATVIDVLAEYGEDCNAEQIDKDIEILAWQPLPKPYKGGDDE